MYRLRYSDSSYTGTVRNQLLDFQGGIGNKGTSQDAGYYWRWVIGMEFASFFNSMGVKVHMVEMMPEILGVMDKENQWYASCRICQTGGVTFYLNTKVVEVNLMEL